MQVTSSSNVQLAQNMLSALKAKGETEGSASAQTESNYDSLKISDEKDSSLEQGLSILKQAKKESTQKESELSKQIKCMKIAARIMNGDNVPLKDRKFLAENAPEMLEKAMLLRRVNEDPKDYDSIVEDEENENGETEEASSGEEMPVSEGEAEAAAETAE